MTKRFCLRTAVVVGAGAAINGLFMIMLPAGCHVELPALTTAGARQSHRDIGIVFLFVGDAFLVGATWPAYRVPLWGAASLWLGGTALIHLCEVVAGVCDPSVLMRDIPTVTLPAVIGGALTLWAVRDRCNQAATAPDLVPPLAQNH
jgi:hypothetical protein